MGRGDSFTSGKQRRAGFTVLESCVAAALLVATAGLMVGLLTGIARQRQAASLHAQAILAADNLLERITGEPYASLTPEHVAELRLAANIEELLPDAEVNIELSEQRGSPPAKRIGVGIAWHTRPTAPASWHRVATWVYRAEEQP